MGAEAHTHPEHGELRIKPLLPLLDTSMSGADIEHSLAATVLERDMTHHDSKENRARFTLNSGLVIARAMHHFADLASQPNYERQQTLDVTRLASEAELHLDNVIAQDGLRDLTSALMDTMVRHGDTNLLRTIKAFEKKYGRRFPEEVVRARRIALLMLTK